MKKSYTYEKEGILMKKIIYPVIVAVLLSFFSVNANESIDIYKDKAVTVSGREAQLRAEPFKYVTDREFLYVPVDDVVPLCGGVLGWDAQKGAQVCVVGDKTYYIYQDKNEVGYNGQNIWFNAPSMIKDGIMYISDELIEKLTGAKLKIMSDFPEYGRISVLDGKTKCYINGVEKEIGAQPYKYQSKIFLPMDSILKQCGATLGWDSQLNAVICIRNGVTSHIFTTENKIITNHTEQKFDLPVMDISGVSYISEDMIKFLTGFECIGYGDIKRQRSGLENTTRTDAYRLGGGNVLRGGGVTVVDGFGMEMVSITDSGARNYAGVLNEVAQTLDGCNVYNILVPTAAEFYAPAGMYPNQLSGMKTVYANLSDRVIPVNVYDILAEHANEKIYFSTDHHWTQRGAYYAYKEFIEQKGGQIDELSTFNNVPSYNFTGSLSGFAKGTAAGDVMKNSPELLERFVPKYATVGTVFSDQNRTQKSHVVDAVNTGYNSYSCFVGGDGPVTVFYTDAPSNESIVIIKESFGNAFATWAMHNYKTVCIIDPRKFNGFGGSTRSFNLKVFCNDMGINDVVFINYPVAVSSSDIRSAILKMK